MSRALPDRRPLVMAVTGRRATGAGGAEAVVAQVEAAADAGVDLVQIREPSLTDRQLYAAVRQAASRLAGGSTQLLVNDRLDLALAVGGVGVHLRSHSVKGADARRWLPAALPLGRSVHSLAEARAAVEGGGLNYLVWGTVFPTVSKPGATTSGPSPIREASRTVSLPILAIGGITVDNSREVFCEGAAGVAAIGLFGEVREPARLRSVVGEIRQRYIQSHGPDQATGLRRS